MRTLEQLDAATRRAVALIHALREMRGIKDQAQADVNEYIADVHRWRDELLANTEYSSFSSGRLILEYEKTYDEFAMYVDVGSP